MISIKHLIPTRVLFAPKTSLYFLTVRNLLLKISLYRQDRLTPQKFSSKVTPDVSLQLIFIVRVELVMEINLNKEDIAELPSLLWCRWRGMERTSTESE